MKDVKTAFDKTFDLFIETLEEYYSLLLSRTSRDSKEQISEYYQFCCKLTDILACLDSLTSDISDNIAMCSALNDNEGVTEFSEIFEQSIALRRIAEQFFEETEKVIQKSNKNPLAELKNQTDIAKRKALTLKKQKAI